MDNGGADLSNFFKNDATIYFTTDRQNKVDNFIVQLHTLFLGLKIFKDNGIIHHDIKPQNILFNQKTGKINYIDFGLMTTKQNIIDATKYDACGYCMFHWSYPLPLGILNDRKYWEFYKITNTQREKIGEDIAESIIGTNTNYNPMNKTYGVYEMFIEAPQSYQLTFSYLNKNLNIPPVRVVQNYIDSFIDSFTVMQQMYSQDIVVDRVINSIDIYGVGITIAFIAGSLFTGGFITKTEYIKLFGFSKKMWDFDIKYVILDVNKLIKGFETLMNDMGILDRLNITFVDNNIVYHRPHSTPRTSSPDARQIIPPQDTPHSKHPSARIEAFAYEDPIPVNDETILRKQCPDKKEINPHTGRCINKCNPNYIRSTDAKFKCIRENCPDKKEINPRTRRCVNKCKPNYSRSTDAKFKCIRENCPDKKKINPRTRRCVNKCKPNYSRSTDGKFKCVSNKKNKTIKNS